MPFDELRPNVRHISRDGLHTLERLPDGDLVVDGVRIEQPLSVAEAGAEVDRRARAAIAAKKFNSYGDAVRAVLATDHALKRAYVGTAK